MKITKRNVIPQCVAVGIIFQLLLIMFSNIGFSCFKYPSPARFIAVSGIAMAILCIGAFVAIRIADAKNYARPTRFRIDMGVFGVALLAGIVFLAIYRCQNNAQRALLLLVTLAQPLYEGVVYRGLMWHKTNKTLHNKLQTWGVSLGVTTLTQLFYTFNIYKIMMTAGDALADPANIVLGILAYGLVVNAALGGVRAGVHNFTFPALLHSLINLALMYFVVL